MIKFGEEPVAGTKDAAAAKREKAPVAAVPVTDLLDGDVTGAGDKPKPARKRAGGKAAKAKPSA